MKRWVFFLFIFFALRVESAEERKIPAVLHWIHLKQEPLSQEQIIAIKSWQNTHPQWTYKLWTHFPSSLDKVVMCPIGPEITDTEILKKEILEREGGVWIHLDLLGCKPLDPLAYKHKSFISFDPHAMRGCAPHCYEGPTVLPDDFILPDQVFTAEISSFPLSGVCFWRFNDHPRLTGELLKIQNVKIKKDVPILSLNRFNKTKNICCIFALFFIATLVMYEFLLIKIMKGFFILFKYLLPSCVILCALFTFKAKNDIRIDSFLHVNQVENFSPLSSQDQRDIHIYNKRYSAYFENCAQPGGEILIPHVVHFIWGGEKPFPETSIHNVLTWKKFHPDWTFKFWTDIPSRCVPVPGMEKHLFDEIGLTQIEPYLATAKNWGERSDLLRYQILYNEGGVYVDHDVECFRSFEPIHSRFTFFAPIEPLHLSPLKDNYVVVTNCLIGAQPGHPILWETLQTVAQRWDHFAQMFPNDDRDSTLYRTLGRTFYSFNDVVSQLMETTDKAFIFPASWIFPKHFPSSHIEMLKLENCVFADHKWENTWFKNLSSRAIEVNPRASAHSLPQLFLKALKYNIFVFALLSSYMVLRNKNFLAQFLRALRPKRTRHTCV